MLQLFRVEVRAGRKDFLKVVERGGDVLGCCGVWVWRVRFCSLFIISFVTNASLAPNREKGGRGGVSKKQTMRNKRGH